MASKELIEKVAWSICLDDMSGDDIFDQLSPAQKEQFTGNAKAAISTILAAVDESALHTIWTMGNCRMPFDKFKDRILLAVLAASALGEQSE